MINVPDIRVSGSLNVLIVRIVVVRVVGPLLVSTILVPPRDQRADLPLRLRLIFLR